MDSAAQMALASHLANIVTDCATALTDPMNSTVVSLLPAQEECQALVVVMKSVCWTRSLVSLVPAVFNFEPVDPECWIRIQWPIRKGDMVWVGESGKIGGVCGYGISSCVGERYCFVAMRIIN